MSTPQDARSRAVAATQAYLLDYLTQTVLPSAACTDSKQLWLGIGTGSTVAQLMADLGPALTALCRTHELALFAVPTSYQAQQLILAQDPRIWHLATLDAAYGRALGEDRAPLDACFDGADEVTPTGAIIKGGGAAHLQEKLVAAASDHVLIVAEEAKWATTGLLMRWTRGVPLAILPDAAPLVARQLSKGAWTGRLRMSGAGKMGPVVTDQGHLVMDAFPSDQTATAASPLDAPATADWLKSLTGVVEHGLFVNIAHTVIIGLSDPAKETLLLHF